MGFTEKKNAEARIYPAGHSLLNHALQKRNKLLYSHKILYTNIHDSFIYNSQKLKPTQMLCNVFVVKQAVIYPYNGLSNKRKTESLLYTTTWVGVKSITLSEKGQFKSLHTIQMHLFNILKMAKL